MPSPQTTPRQKDLTSLSGPSMLTMSPHVCWRTFSPEGHKRLRVTPRIHPARGKPSFPACRRGTWRRSKSRKECRGPRRGSTGRTPQALSWLSYKGPRRQNGSDEKPWDSWPKQWDWSGRGCWAQARSLEHKHHPCMEVSMPPVPKVPRDHITTSWAQWHWDKSASSRKSLNSSFTKRLLQEIGQSIMMDIRFHGITMGALQESAKAYFIRLFEDTYLCAIHTKRVMILPRDIQLAHGICGKDPKDPLYGLLVSL